MNCNCRPKGNACCPQPPQPTSACPPAGVVLLCDTTPSMGVVRFVRIFHSNGDTTDFTLSGAPYSPTGPVGDCGTEVVRARGRTVTDAAPWPAPGEITGTVTSLTASGVTGSWSVTDADGNPITGLTAASSLRWDPDGENQLVPPRAITPAAGGSVTVTWTQR